MGKPAPHLPPAWDAAIAKWVTWLRDAGNTSGTIKLRRVHVRTVAGLSRTVRPDQLTSDALVLIADRQQWAYPYRRALRTSLASFYEWAVQTGSVRSDPVAQTPSDLIGSQILKVRLHPYELAALTKVAEHRGLLPSTVVRQQIVRLLTEDIGYSHV